MAITQNSYIGNNATTQYPFTFPYLKTSDIKCSIDATVTTAFTLANATTVQFNTAPGLNAKIKIYRETDDDALTATFYAGSAIKSEDLNDNFAQNLYTTQEVNARFLSNLGGTMVGDLTMGEDADIIFEGATDDAHETTLTVADPTADRTITLPNVTGTVVTTGDTGTVATGMIAADAIVAAKIADNAVDSSHIAANSVGTSEIADGGVQALNIASNAITNAKIDANAVTTDKIAAGTIINDDISGSASIDHTKIAAITQAHVLMGNSSNVPTATPISGDVTLSNTGAVTIATGAVEHSMLAGDCIDGDNIQDDVVNSEHIAADSLDTEHYAPNSVDTTALAADAVTGAQIADNAIGAEHIAANAVGTSEIADAELTTLAGMQSGTASILASGTALTSTTAELNLLDGKSIVTTISGSSTDAQLPTAQAVDERITAVVTDVGGFRPIANETSFPATNPDPEDNAGTLVSLKALSSNLVSNGSGVATISNGAGSGNTVTITGLANSTTYAAGKGLILETTSTLHTYSFHREALSSTQVSTAQTLVSDFGDRYQVAGSTPSAHPDSSALQEGDLWFDTNANTMKVYDGSSYSAVTSVGDYKLLTVVPDGASTGTPDYTNVSFDLRDGGSAASITSVGQLLVSVNGVLQKPNSTSWSASNEGFHLEGTNGIKFCTAPGSGASVFVTLIGSATSVNVPATNSIVEAAIQTNQVSEEKLKISNAGTNGQFLSKQSGDDGGLTWATVSTSDATKMPLAGGTFTGDVTFDNQTTAGNDIRWDESTSSLELDDDVTLWFGDSRDFSISHTSNANHITVQQGPIWINAGAGIDISTGASDIKAESPVVLEAYTSGTGGRLSLRSGIASGTGSDRELQLEGPATMAATYRMILPQAAPTSNDQALTATTAGVCSWSTIESQDTLSNRNLIINGAMNVAQRATSETSANGYQGFTTVDRWRLAWNGAENIIEAHQEQLTSSDTGPWALGFRNAWKLVNGDQTGGQDANGHITPQYAIEAQDVASSGWVHTDPNSKITLSFWVKSSVAQTFYAYVRSMHGTSQSYPISYAVSANTWTKVTKTIPGHANVQIDNDNSAGLYLFFPTFFGTDRTDSGVSLNAWGAYSGSARTPDYTTSNSSWYNTNDATWHLTGVQVEVGDTATKFEHRQYGDELLRCQRYFYTITSIPGLTHATEDLGAAFAASGTEVQFPLNFPVFMRSTPAIEQRQGTEWFLIGQGNYGGNKFLSNNWIINNMAPNRGNLYTAPDANLSSYIGQMGTIQSKNTSARLGMVSEI